MTTMYTEPPDVLHVVADAAAPGSDRWRRTITASKIAGIVGVSGYATPYRVWHELSGTPAPPPTAAETERYTTGHAMELALRYWLAEHHPEWTMSRGEVQATHPGLPFPNAATPDLIATNRGRRRSRAHSRTVQLKTVGDWDEYAALTADTIPDAWLAQVTWEMYITGLTRNPAVLAVAGPYYDWQELAVEFDEDLAAHLVAAAGRMWESVETGDGPPAPTNPRDVKIARAAYPGIDDTAAPVPLTATTTLEWVAAKRIHREASASDRAAKKDADLAAAAVLEEMGEAAEAVDQEGRVVARRVGTKRGVQLRFVDPEE